MNNPHQWGLCLVADWTGGPQGHLIISYTGGTHVVHNGMVWGWFDNGGAPGALGCPVTDEHPYLVGVRQDFQHGSLFWFPGMDHAKLVDPAAEPAINWAWAHNTQHYMAGLCLGFAVTAWNQGAGTHLSGPYGPYVTAVQWWNAQPAKHSGDTSPPPGALAFWKNYAGGAGHVALSVGGGWAISTSFIGNNNVHAYRIDSYPTNYLGWVPPSR